MRRIVHAKDLKGVPTRNHRVAIDDASNMVGSTHTQHRTQEEGNTNTMMQAIWWEVHAAQGGNTNTIYHTGTTEDEKVNAPRARGVLEWNATVGPHTAFSASSSSIGTIFMFETATGEAFTETSCVRA